MVDELRNRGVFGTEALWISAFHLVLFFETGQDDVFILVPYLHHQLMKAVHVKEDLICILQVSDGRKAHVFLPVFDEVL